MWAALYSSVVCSNVPCYISFGSLRANPVDPVLKTALFAACGCDCTVRPEDKKQKAERLKAEAEARAAGKVCKRQPQHGGPCFVNLLHVYFSMCWRFPV